MRKSKTLTSLMCALCLTTSAYAVNIDQGSDLTVDATVETTSLPVINSR